MKSDDAQEFYTDPKEIYGRAQTAIAMAKGESCKLRSYLQIRIYALRQEADDIEEMLKKAGEHTDMWYDAIVSEHDAIRRAQHTP